MLCELFGLCSPYSLTLAERKKEFQGQESGKLAGLGKTLPRSFRNFSHFLAFYL